MTKVTSWGTAKRIGFNLTEAQYAELKKAVGEEKGKLNDYVLDLALALPHTTKRSLEAVLESSNWDAARIRAGLKRRPPALPMKVELFVNDEHLEALRENAARHGLKVSEYVRRQVTMRDVRELDFHENAVQREKRRRLLLTNLG